ncbi:alpha/beta hydrolase [Akkermansiaceae bacterium]|nr:alpha/beta hydrolase [Akkermansiaceae bacterium]
MKIPTSRLPGIRYLSCLLLSLWVTSLSAEPEKINLWEAGKAPDGRGGFTDEEAFVLLHRPEKPNGAAMVICPGGGYGGLVMGGEGNGIAEWLNKQGITGIVLKYRLPKGRAEVPLLDAQRAIRLARENAKPWAIDEKKLGIIGFSAGGHLASTVATHFGKGKEQDAISCRPDFAILIYPVITMRELTHGGSRRNLLGAEPSPEMVKLFSNELQVNAETPPVYLAHAKDDKVVPPENSMSFHEAMKSHGRESEYLELPSGGHGLNGYKGPMWDAWQRGSLEWLARQGLVPAKVKDP